MDKNKKKITAAAAAVVQYIKSEEVCLAAQTTALPVEKRRLAPEVWGLSGRQAQMQMRSLMQMKSFHTARAR
jgi:hypothetical protein